MLIGGSVAVSGCSLLTSLMSGGWVKPSKEVQKSRLREHGDITISKRTYKETTVMVFELILNPTLNPSLSL